MSNIVEELSIEITNECTLACLHCSSGSVPQKGKNELTVQELTRIMHEARVLGAKTLSLSGGNPLLHPQLLQLLYRAQDLKYQRILIYTTGHSHYGRTIDLHSSTVAMLQIPEIHWIFSLHSHDYAVNDALMNVPGTTAEVIQSIGWLKANGAKVEIHMVPMKPNYEHIPQVRDLCRDMGISKLSLLRFVPQTRGKANIDALGMNKRDFIRMQMILADEMARQHPVQIRAGCPIDFRHSIGELDGKAKPCHAGDDLILVRPNGAVHPCAAWKSLPSDSNVRFDSLIDIWEQSHTFTAIREFKNDGYLLVSGCAACTMLESCKTGCPAQRLHAYGNKSMDDLHLACSDPLCPKGNDGCPKAG